MTVKQTALSTLSLAVWCGIAHALPPRTTSDRYKLELVAAEPDIVTPIGLTFDRKGRLLVVESHTHERPENYDGPTGDRLRMFADSNGDGRLDRWTTFAEGFRHAMNVLARDDGGVYLVTRGELLLLQDMDDDGVADRQRQLLRLETDDDYPHNALGGIDQAADGSLVIGLGENHGLPFRLFGSDGKVIAATGGLDGFFRCAADGANLEHFARGVWNPFSLCALPDGRIFAVDNDPDASPPCRLLHVVPGGDYGYLYQYGRAGTHPLQAWNGELPGTLPMVCGTGESPTAIVPHAGSLWVTSWGDHRIERYRLVPRGASYTAEREVVVQGDADFRPTGMAVAPDGSLYFGDWIHRDYEVHGEGRIWRLVLPAEEIELQFSPAVDAKRLDRPVPANVSDIWLFSKDPFIHAARVQELSQRDSAFLEFSASNSWGDPRVRLGRLEALRLKGADPTEKTLRHALNDKSPEVRLFVVRWIADERISSLRDDVAKLLEGPQPSSRYYLAVLAAIDWLDNEPSLRGSGINDELLVRELKNTTRSPAARALSLKLLSPDHKYLTLDRLRDYIQSDHPALRSEAVRSLALQSDTERFALLAEVASDSNHSDAIRADAIAGLAGAADRYHDFLEQLADGDQTAVAQEADRLLRLTGVRPAPTEEKPAADNLAEWVELLDEPGGAESGRRLFFGAVGPRCGACHQHGGRGGRIGPDLTKLAESNTRDRIITSILQPSQEIAPHYQPWILITDDGKTHTGLRMPKAGDNGIEDYVDSAGKPFSLPSNTIVERHASNASIMPDNIQTTLSIADLRDLLMFLATKAD